MASLMKKLFETMPLEGLRSNFADLWGYQPPIGILAGYLWATVEEEYDLWVDPPVPSEAAVADATHGDKLRIWGWKANSARPLVAEITCRVRDDEFKQYVVLDKLEFGYSPPEAPTELKPSVRITRRGKPIELPLDERFRLATFWTTGGALVEDESVRYPLKSLHDQGLVYVFAFDVPVYGDDIVALRDASHPDAAEVEKFLSACRSLHGLTAEDDRSATEVLFADDLWHPEQAEQPGAGILDGTSWGELALTPTRVVVAIAVTFCKERDDYVMGHFTPGWLVGMARLYPQIMTVSTRSLELIESAVRFTRPTHTTIIGGHQCGCGEMLTDIGMGFWNDTNDGNEIRGAKALGVIPRMPYWEMIFNYYLADPDRDPELLNKRVNFVRAYGGGSTVIEGAVERFCPFASDNAERANRITRLPRQGAFDNVHVAPRMRVNQSFNLGGYIDSDTGVVRSVPFTGAAAWKMDRVVMAPFCAHDCFHLHTRWGDAFPAEKHTKGFTLGGPYAGAAAPMVPINHAAHVVPLGPNAFVYVDEAIGVRPDDWGIACYHGAAYAISVGGQLDMAQVLMTKIDPRRDTQYLLPPPELGWALFYWLLRHHFTCDSDGNVIVGEAVRFIDRDAALGP